MMHSKNDKKTLTEKDAAEYTGMSRSFLRQDRMNGQRGNRTPGPPYVKIARSVRYLTEDLDRWLQEHRIDNGTGGEL
jgi:predicted DNA-binding transcriptional regulator AlpA